MGVLNTLFTRALRVSDNDHLDSEKEHLRNVFLSNGYNLAQINKALKKQQKPRGIDPRLHPKRGKWGIIRHFSLTLKGPQTK